MAKKDGRLFAEEEEKRLAAQLFRDLVRRHDSLPSGSTDPIASMGRHELADEACEDAAIFAQRWEDSAR
jgi:hypothetical protein